MELNPKAENNIDFAETEQFLGDLMHEAGEILRRHFRDKNYTRHEKEGVDFTTQADKEVDEFLVKEISARFPGHKFLTEETAPKDYYILSGEENLWVIDPLDGTINFSRGIEHFSISVALMQKGEVVLGAVFIPMTGQFYSARKDGSGALLNGEEIHVSMTKDLRETVVGCDWAWGLDKRKNVVNWLRNISPHVRQIACRGSGVADLASLAEGKIDVYLHSGVKPWDVAAAGFIIQKAGGKVTNADGSEWGPFDPEIFASNGILHKLVSELLGDEPVKVR